MKAVLISIQPQWCELIASGKKTIEVRKTYPNIETPFKCYIYMTATKECCRFWEYITAYQNSKGEILDGSQKVIGEFVCDEIIKITEYPDKEDSFAIEYEKGLNAIEQSCLETKDVEQYAKGKPLYGWRISDLKIYDKPKKLGEFYKKCKLDPDECGNCDFHGLIRKRYEIIGHCFADGKKKITRPPQSWCYVEE